MSRLLQANSPFFDVLSEFELSRLHLDSGSFLACLEAKNLGYLPSDLRQEFGQLSVPVLC